jgi:hypothetical protein
MNVENKNDEEQVAIRHLLQNAPVPEPIGGHDATRERVMGKVRHKFPPESAVPKRGSFLFRSLGAGAIIAGIGLVVFFAMPAPSAEADELPTNTQMQQFYDQHETNHTAHFQEAKMLGQEAKMLGASQ